MRSFFIFIVFIGTGYLLAVKLLPDFFSVEFDGRASVENLISSDEENVAEVPVIKEFKTPHIATPEPMKAIYMSACVAGTPSIRNKLVTLIEETELNAVVIDIKDYSGHISFAPNDTWNEYVSKECSVSDMKEFLTTLYEKNIYRIGRVTVFQDPFFAKKRPDLAVKKSSDKSVVWKDNKGLSFMDAGSKEVWDHAVSLAKDSHKAGFDEINFDYIRFPSDGNMKDIYFEHSLGKNKAEVIESFWKYLHDTLKPEGIVISGDVFGMTTTNYDDLNIGQLLEPALMYFDYVAPMVYPSHYPKNFMGFADPNKHVYEVVNHSMKVAVSRAVASTTKIKLNSNERIGTSTPAVYTFTPQDELKLRPWLQDFDYGGNYDIAEVKAQIKATYDAGLTSWFLWSPSNKYTRGALNEEVGRE